MASTRATPMDFARLADLAERRGVRILVEPIGGEHFATSASNPTLLYRLTHWSCSCRGFITWQRCSHYALFLSQLGWLPEPAGDDPEPEPPAPAATAAPARCGSCHGRGTEQIADAIGTWHRVNCAGCGGAGTVEDRDHDGPADADDLQATPYDSGRVPIQFVPRDPTAGLTAEEVVALKGDALRQAVDHGLPLIDPFSGRVIDRHNCHHREGAA